MTWSRLMILSCEDLLLVSHPLMEGKSRYTYSIFSSTGVEGRARDRVAGLLFH